jgi:zinc protease
MSVTRRDALKGMMLGGALSALPVTARSAEPEQPSSFVLDNGLRVHCLAKRSGYVNAALILRSREIGEPGGLAHLMEHTSFTGAAGSFAAADIKRLRQDCIQDSNATTAPGTIQWNASFLPRNTARVLEMLAVTSLDQRFDVETVEREARVVLQELYLIKYETNTRAKRQFDEALYGKSHPYARDTVETEIAKAKTPPRRLARELSAFAEKVRLPANMDLFVVGEIDPGEVRDLATRHFGSYPYASAPMLDLPSAQVTRGYNALSVASSDLVDPLTEIKIAWNTGVRITDPDSMVLLALGGCLNGALFDHIRDKLGDAYTPEAVYDCDRSCGIFEILLTSSRPPETVEARVFEAITALKRSVRAADLERFRDRFELMRRKKAESVDAILETMVSRALNGKTISDFDVAAIAPEDVLQAARKYLPSHKGAYVRLALVGK